MPVFVENFEEGTLYIGGGAVRCVTDAVPQYCVVMCFGEKQLGEQSEN